MASYFAVYKGMEDGLAKLALAANPAHDTPFVQRAFQILESAWLSVRSLPLGCCRKCIPVNGGILIVLHMWLASLVALLQLQG